MSGLPPRARDLVLERKLFGVLLLLQAGFYAWLILGRRLMTAHDTLFEYQVQYLFLAHALQNADLGVWFPGSMHGVLSNWHANFQGSLLQNILLLVGGVPEGTNMLPVYHFGKFLEEFILLLGTWRLSRHYYGSPYARFFVGVAVLGSTFWASQFSFNFKLFYGIPLILSLLHDFLATGRRGTLAVAGLFAALQFTGTITYVPLLTLATVAMYALTHLLLFPAFWRDRVRGLRLRPGDVAGILVIGGVLVSIILVFAPGASTIRHYRPGRGSDASVSLDAFLTYAGTLSPGRYADFFLGATPSLDYNLYCGMAVPFMALLALIAMPGRPVLHLGICTLLLLLFSMGFLSLVAAVAFELIPPLRFFRYASLAAPLVKLFVIFLSGYGVQALVEGRVWKSSMVDRLFLPLLLVLVGAGVVLTFGLIDGDIPGILGTGGSGLANRNAASLNLPVAISGAFGLLFAGLLVLARRGMLNAAACVGVLLALETVDVFRFKINLFREETVALNDTQFALQQVRTLPFVPRRTDRDASDRYRILQPLLADYGAQYDLVENFSHVESVLTRRTILFWMPPFESLVQAIHAKPPETPMDGLPSLPGNGGSVSASKVLGARADKLQVFAKAHVPGSDLAVAELLRRPDFKGDILLLGTSPTAPLPALPPPELLQADERLGMMPELLHFDMNQLRVKLDVPPGRNDAWLFYSDVWDPGWRATVNGKPVPVEKAFLAYKAIRLQPGSNEVSFRFHAPARIWSYRVLGLASAVFVISSIVLAMSLLGVLPIRKPAP